ncbi:MAG: hypothetical protein WCI75_15335, partial [candidate division NC10 bacterium]
DSIGGGTGGSSAAPVNPQAPALPDAKPVGTHNVSEGFWQDYARSILSLLKMPFDASSTSEIGPENRVWHARDRMNANDPGLKAWSQLNSAAEASRAGSAVPVDDAESEDLLGADQLAAETGQPYDANAVGRQSVPVRLKTKYNKPERSTLPFGSPTVDPVRE